MSFIILIIAVVWLVPCLLIITTSFTCALLPSCRRWVKGYLFGSNSDVKPASSPDFVRNEDQATRLLRPAEARDGRSSV